VWSRKRLDIGWSDFMYGVWRTLAPRDAVRAAADVESLWPEPARMLACLSVRSGFDMLLCAAALPPGSEVLVSAVTIPDMVRIVEHHGLIAVPVDLDPLLAAPRMEDWEKAVTPKTRAILVAHLVGGRMPMGPLVEFARRRGLMLFEDAAQAFSGVGYAGHPEADASFFSFGVIKSDTAIGGAVLSIRNREILGTMRAAQAAYPRQSRFGYFRRLAKYGLLKVLSNRVTCGLIMRGFRILGGNYDSWVNQAARGFAGKDFFMQIRRQPSAPLMALLARRLRRFDDARHDRHVVKGQEMAQALQDSNTRENPPVCPGAACRPHTFWVFPVLVEEPQRLIDELARHGFDATQGQSLCVVPPPRDRGELRATAAQAMLEKIVFLPFYPELPLHEARRMAGILLSGNHHFCQEHGSFRTLEQSHLAQRFPVDAVSATGRGGPSRSGRG
jgi:perosamine synthetase